MKVAMPKLWEDSLEKNKKGIQPPPPPPPKKKLLIIGSLVNLSLSL